MSHDLLREIHLWRCVMPKNHPAGRYHDSYSTLGYLSKLWTNDVYSGLAWSTEYKSLHRDRISACKYRLQQPIMIYPGFSCTGIGKRGRPPSPGATCMHCARIRECVAVPFDAAPSPRCGRDRNQGQLQLATRRKSKQFLLHTWLLESTRLSLF